MVSDCHFINSIRNTHTNSTHPRFAKLSSKLREGIERLYVVHIDPVVTRQKSRPTCSFSCIRFRKHLQMLVAHLFACLVSSLFFSFRVESKPSASLKRCAHINSLEKLKQPISCSKYDVELDAKGFALRSILFLLCYLFTFDRISACLVSSFLFHSV